MMHTIMQFRSWICYYCVQAWTLCMGSYISHRLSFLAHSRGKQMYFHIWDIHIQLQAILIFSIDYGRDVSYLFISHTLHACIRKWIGTTVKRVKSLVQWFFIVTRSFLANLTRNFVNSILENVCIVEGFILVLRRFRRRRAWRLSETIQTRPS